MKWISFGLRDAKIFHHSAFLHNPFGDEGSDPAGGGDVVAPHPRRHVVPGDLRSLAFKRLILDRTDDMKMKYVLIKHIM